MRRVSALAVVFVVAFASVRAAFAQSGEPGETIPIRIIPPTVSDVRLALGFNYDLLRPLTNVSFTDPVGYFGTNLPLRIGGNLRTVFGDELVDQVFSDTNYFRNGEIFNPTASAAQNPNFTVRVDVPMLSGVGSFAYTQNFFFNLTTAVGGTGVVKELLDINDLIGNGAEVSDPEAMSLSGYLALSGALRLPLTIGMGWETMTFGYAYKVNTDDNLIFALNLHRHLFSMDVRLRADIDLLGHMNARGSISDGMGGTQSLVIDDEIINFSSDICNGSAQGRFSAEAWTPSFAVKWQRFSLNSRFGLDTRVKGSATGGFVMPRILDLETGTLNLGGGGEGLEAFGNISSEVDTITYEINETMRWKMPHGHTLAFDIIPNRFSVSYTKLFGEINLKIDEIVTTTTNDVSWVEDIREIDLGVKVDHIFMLQLNYPSFFFNLGFGGLEIRSKDSDVLKGLEQFKSLKLGDVVMMMPVLSGGVDLGTKLRLRLEADILPVQALRTGVIYYF